MLSECAQAAFPAGVVNILTGGDELGQMIVEHPKVSHISFTGSAATGKKIMATGAGTLKKVTLELGGSKCSSSFCCCSSPVRSEVAGQTIRRSCCPTSTSQTPHPRSSRAR